MFGEDKNGMEMMMYIIKLINIGRIMFCSWNNQ